MTARQRSGLGAKNFRSTGLALLLFSLLILSGRASFAGKTSANLDMYLESELFSVRVKASRQDWHLGLASSSESPRYAELAHRFKVSKQTDLYPNIGLGRDGNGFLSIGLAGSYLDYRIGTWALNSEWEARGGLDGFQLKIDADYSIGNLSARARGRLFQGQTGLWWES
ncbi:MAG: hypothetical protein ACLFO3_06610, partial [Candidatus Acetothermia bacterium]